MLGVPTNHFLLLPRILSLRGSAAIAHGVTGSLRIVPSWYWCTSNSGLGQICGYSAHSVEGRVLRTTANRPGQYSFLSDFIHKFHTHLVDSTYPLSSFVNWHKCHRYVLCTTSNGQLFGAIAQPIFQVLGPMYSETWFDLKGRTTATMILSVGVYRLQLSSVFQFDWFYNVSIYPTQPTQWEARSVNLSRPSQGIPGTLCVFTVHSAGMYLIH